MRELGAGATPNGEGNDNYAGRTPLGCAAGSTYKQGEKTAWGTVRDPLGCMGELLDAGAEPDRPQSGDGMTPILLALKVKGYDRVLLLVDRGADLTQADGKGETPLSLLGP
eukprot:COSAG02_NODE_32890_length_508_cov_20862.310513_1_plen_110_part_01